MLRFALEQNGPASMRYPKAGLEHVERVPAPMEPGRAEVHEWGEDAVLDRVRQPVPHLRQGGGPAQERRPSGRRHQCPVRQASGPGDLAQGGGGVAACRYRGRGMPGGRLRQPPSSSPPTRPAWIRETWFASACRTSSSTMASAASCWRSWSSNVEPAFTISSRRSLKRATLGPAATAPREVVG